MSRKVTKTKESAEVRIFPALGALLAELEAPPAPRAKGPGRPTKNRAETTPVILHLYTTHVRWLDDYAAMLEEGSPKAARLSRVEIVRGLLLGLGQFALEHKLQLPDGFEINSERDLQHAIAAALRDACKNVRGK